jgi:hypothetical protein
MPALVRPTVAVDLAKNVFELAVADGSMMNKTIAALKARKETLMYRLRV